MIKTYKSRSSATEMLRKMGVKAINYSSFVKKVGDKFEVNVDAAKKSLVRKTKDGAPTVSSVARGLILAGKDNKTVWEKIKADFDLDDKKRGYPAWYRSEMRRNGTLSA